MQLPVDKHDQDTWNRYRLQLADILVSRAEMDRLNSQETQKQQEKHTFERYRHELKVLLTKARQAAKQAREAAKVVQQATAPQQTTAPPAPAKSNSDFEVKTKDNSLSFLVSEPRC
jgi:hypothetical protein